MYHSCCLHQATRPTFLFPSTNPVSGCNLSAPLCQPGSIFVDVLAATRTTRTTVPCSSYLFAQSFIPAGSGHWLLSSYSSSFFQSPECTHRTPIGLRTMGLCRFCRNYSNCLDSMPAGPGRNRVESIILAR